MHFFCPYVEITRGFFFISAALLIYGAKHKAIGAVTISISKGWNLLTTTEKDIYLVKRKLLRKMNFSCKALEETR